MSRFQKATNVTCAYGKEISICWPSIDVNAMYDVWDSSKVSALKLGSLLLNYQIT